MFSSRFFILKKFVCMVIAVIFGLQCLMPASTARADVLGLPAPGAMVGMSPAFVPTLLKGVTVNPDNPFKFEFILDTGNELTSADLQKANQSAEASLRSESKKLINYFLAAMTVPQKDLWVNLSPNEPDRIIPKDLGKIELGQDLLAQDYILKQLTATLMRPEGEAGRELWDRIYARAQKEFGTTDIPLDTFNKVWIMPESATIYEHENTVYITEAKLKVMTENDYQKKDISTQIIRNMIVPEIEKEVNTGKNFAPLRQMFYSLILAKWYKDVVQNSILNKVYVGKNKVNNLLPSTSDLSPQKIYDQYMKAFKSGVYNVIKEEYNPQTKQIIPRKYFSGGFTDSAMIIKKAEAAKIVPTGEQRSVEVILKTDNAMLIRTKEDFRRFLRSTIIRGSRYSAHAVINGQEKQIDMQIPPQMDLEQPVKQVTFVLDMNRTLMPGATQDQVFPILDENLEQIVRAFRLMKKNRDLKVRFILMTGSAYKRYIESRFAPKMSEWDWDLLSKQAGYDVKESIKTELAGEGKTIETTQAVPFVRETIAERVAKPILKKLREEGLEEYASNIEMFTASGAEHITYSSNFSEFVFDTNKKLVFDEEEQREIARTLSTIYLDKLGSKSGQNLSLYIARIKRASSFIGKDGINDIFNEAMRFINLDARFWSFDGEIAIIYHHDYQLDGNEIAKEAIEQLKAAKVIRRDFSEYHLGGGSSFTKITLFSNDIIVANETSDSEMIVSVGDSLNDAHVTNPRNEKTLSVLLGRRNDVKDNARVILAIDERGQDLLQEQGTAVLMQNIFDVMEIGGTWGDVKFLNVQGAPNQILRDLPENWNVSNMASRKIKEDNLNILGIGTVWFGRQWRTSTTIPEYSEIKKFLLSVVGQYPNLDAKIMLDTAAAYGTSEEQIGVFFKNYPELRDRFFIATKGGEETPANPGEYGKKDFSEEFLRSSLRRSIERLGKVDLFYVHSAPIEVLRDGGFTDAMKKLKAETGIKYIGATVSTSSLAAEENFEKAVNENLYDWADVIQVSAKIFLSRRDLMARLKEKGIAIVVNYPTQIVQEGNYAEIFNKLKNDQEVSVILTGTRNHLSDTIGYVENNDVDLAILSDAKVDGRRILQKTDFKRIIQEAVEQIDISQKKGSVAVIDSRSILRLIPKENLEIRNELANAIAVVHQQSFVGIFESFKSIWLELFDDPLYMEGVRNLYLLVNKDGDIEGFISFDIEQKDQVRVPLLAIARDQWNRGKGVLLLDVLFEELRHRRIKEFWGRARGIMEAVLFERYLKFRGISYKTFSGDLSAGVLFQAFIVGNKNEATLDSAMESDLGGIDMSAVGFRRVDGTGPKIEFNFDPAMLQEFQSGEFKAIITNIVPLSSVLPLLGLAPIKENDNKIGQLDPIDKRVNRS
ncbi:MAG: aldo/keto reductase [Candidatus Omnitrophica bacterium]|nr:aldo/keto reductase [Candidatus Omnitrophota bacterium]